MARLRFDPVKHEYSVDGVRLPSVTEVLKHQGILRPWTNDQFYRDRGTAIHEAAKILLDGQEIEESSIDPAIFPFVESLRRWLADSRPEPLLVEEPMFDRVYGYAGTPDLATIDGVLYDFKSGGVERGHSVQLAAYVDLCTANGYPMDRAAVVYLMTDGARRTRYIPAAQLRMDAMIFRAALTTYKFLQAEGLAREKDYEQ